MTDSPRQRHLRQAKKLQMAGTAAKYSNGAALDDARAAFQVFPNASHVHGRVAADLSGGIELIQDERSEPSTRVSGQASGACIPWTWLDPSRTARYLVGQLFVIFPYSQDSSARQQAADYVDVYLIPAGRRHDADQISRSVRSNDHFHKACADRRLRGHKIYDF